MHTIELLGLPGVGKTTLVNSLLNDRRARSQSVVDLEYALCRIILRRGEWKSSKKREWDQNTDPMDLTPADRKWLIGKGFHHPNRRFESLAAFVAQHPALIEVIMRIAQFRGDAEQRETINRWLFNLFARYQFVTDQLETDTAVLLDEGFVGRVVSLFAYDPPAPTEQEIEAYITAIPLPDAVFHLVCSTDECHRRLHEREAGPPSRLRDVPASRRFEVMQQAEVCIQFAVNSLRRFDVPVHQVNTEQPLKASVKACLKHLGGAWRSKMPSRTAVR